jgi:hypothetical protein
MTGMSVKLKLLFITSFLLLISCKANNSNSERAFNKRVKEGNIKYFKMQVYCSCLNNAYENKDIIKSIRTEDLLAVFDDLSSPDIQKTVDSLGKIVAQTIKPEEYPDFEGKKRITVKCLEYYTSKELDNIARKRFKKYY